MPDVAESLVLALRDARRRTLALIDDLSDRQLEVQQLGMLNPLRWELGHVAFFFDANVLGFLDGTPPLLPEAVELYDSFRVDHDERWDLPLPSRRATLDYLRRVATAVERRVVECCTERDRYCYELALLHEDMHGEAFLTMRQVLGYPPPALPEPGPPRRPPVDAGPCPGDVHVAGGRFELGAHPGRPQFVFDNEKWSHPVDVASFAIARAPVTNAEFMAFVDDGGYACRALWSAPGWRWRCKHAIESPQYWSRDSGTGAWHRRVFDRHVPLAPHQPMVHVGYHEAEAFCAWAGRRLPSEAEWEMAASVNVSSGGKQLYPWGNELPPLPPANLDAALLGCVDVAAHPGGDSAVGCRQMLGNVWEWTSSSFYPYPGYVVDLPYREYSAPWFGYRKVLRGGSFATRARLVSTTYRNFFTPDRRDIFAGFRTCARTV